MGLRAMKTLFKVTILLLLLMMGAVVFAGSVWDGSVSTARYGYLPQTGMYAASNAFPKNTNITVTNPNTGKTVDVLVIDRLEDNNLFLVLSAEAADSIGIEFGDIFNGNISQQDSTNPLKEEELPYNPDPDINPSALSEDYSELALIQKYIDNELGGTNDSLLVSNVDDPIEKNPESTDTEPFKEPEIVEVVIPEVVEAVIPEVVEDIEEVEKVEDTVLEEITEVVLDKNLDTDVPEVIEIIEIVEEDIPSVDNMPVEEIYISEPKDNLPTPEVVIIPEPELTNESAAEEEDVPVLVGMSADVPVLVAPADLSGVLPELPVPETDVPVFTSINTGTIEEIADGTASIELPELPLIEVEIIEEEIPLAVIMAVDLVPFEDSEEISHILPELTNPGNDDIPDVVVLDSKEPESEPEIILEITEPEIITPEEAVVSLDSETATEMEVEVVLEPSDLRPPVLPDETEVVETDVVETEELPPVIEEAVITDSSIPEPVEVSENYKVTRVLAENSYYLQIGVYREQYSALDLAGRLGTTYPVTVLVSETTNTLNYKVMVGPLGQDESGVVLYSFKSTGYPDAFLRKGL